MVVAKSEGIGKKLSGMQSKMLDRVLNVPEKAPVGWRRNVAIVSWNIGLSILVVAMLSVMLVGPPTSSALLAAFGKTLLHTVANPTIMSFSTIGMAVAIPGLLIGLAVKRAVPEKHHRTLAKIFAVIAPIVCIGAISALAAHAAVASTAHGLVFSASSLVTSPFFIPIVMGVPLTAWSVNKAITTLSQEDVRIHEAHVDTANKQENALERHAHELHQQDYIELSASFSSSGSDSQ